MTKKARKTKKSEKAEIESAAANAELTESTRGVQGDEAVIPDSKPQPEGMEISESSESPSASEPGAVAVPDLPADSPAENSGDELLDDVRRSLIEDETLKEENRPKKWWRRGAKGSKAEKKRPEPQEDPLGAEINLPATSAPEIIEEKAEAKESEEYLNPIDDLIDMLETEADEGAVEPTAVVAAIPGETERAIDIDELKKEAFRPRTEGEGPEDYTEVRSVALEGGEEVFVEVESKAQDPLEERLAALENALRPYRTYIYVGFAFLGLIAAVITSLILFNIYQQSRPPAPVEESNLPFPTVLSLPGGLNFTLARGALKDGEWKPRGPEWLEGTEVCRWVAIPWSRQLEAVIRTLNADDPVELVMSNNDRLVYKVYSIRQLSTEEMQKLDTGSPCLLLVLAEADSDKRWVLTALP